VTNERENGHDHGQDSGRGNESADGHRAAERRMSASSHHEKPSGDQHDPKPHELKANDLKPHELKHEPKHEAKSPSKDIIPMLKGWDYEPGTINVRKINGLDGKQKIQMRLDLGLLQMELTGRPDGATPHGYDSLLDYHEEQLREHKKTNGTELGFHLTASECENLRQEAVMYYHRYLSLFVLEEFPGVVRDTARNLRVLDLCGKYALQQDDQFMLEQYRPYIVMMHTRAKASILFKGKKWKDALEIVKDGLESIREFFAKFDQEEAFNRSNEVKILKKFARDIRKKLPIDPIEKLKSQLQKAVAREHYEDAARLRDEIKRKTEEVE
jgi:UvrB/uvrC motif